MHIYVYIYGILSICCCVSSLSYRYPLHISAWLQANAIMQELPLQYEHCSHRPEKILSPTTTGESSHHYICTAVAAGCRIRTAATTASTTHSHCLSQQMPILLPVDKYQLPVLCIHCQQHMGPCPTKLALSMQYGIFTLLCRSVAAQGFTQDMCYIIKLLELGLHLKRIEMLLISNSFQYTSIWNKKGLIFDSAKSYNKPNVLLCMWQLRP